MLLRVQQASLCLTSGVGSAADTGTASALPLGMHQFGITWANQRRHMCPRAGEDLFSCGSLPQLLLPRPA